LLLEAGVLVVVKCKAVWEACDKLLLSLRVQGALRRRKY